MEFGPDSGESPSVSTSHQAGHGHHSRQAGRRSSAGYVGEYHEAVRIEGVNDIVKYTVVIERAPNNYAAYVPDLPGCVATGGSREELLEEIREAIEFHIESLREHGEPVPEPQSTAAVVEVGAVPAA